MAGELEHIVRRLFDALDKNDPAVAIAALSGDAQGVDEISRRWLRGGEELRGYVTQLMGMVSDVHSDLRDVHESVHGDIGILTCWLEQDYTMEGNIEHVSAPTSVVLLRERGAWKVTLLHSVPLPDAT